MAFGPYNAAMIRAFLEHLAADLRLMDQVARSDRHQPHDELVDAVCRYGEQCGAGMLLERCHVVQGEADRATFRFARALLQVASRHQYARALAALETLGPLLDGVLANIEAGRVYDLGWMTRALTPTELLPSRGEA